MLTLNWHESFTSYMTKRQRGGLLCLQRFLIFHEEMALRNKQSVIHEKQEFVKLRVPD